MMIKASNVQHLEGRGPRIETGVLQFGDDWPGVFIRGDNAFAFRLALSTILGIEEKGGDLGSINWAVLRSLRDLLQSCDTREIEQ